MSEDDFARARVAIVGLGLMGGSLAAALVSRRACAHVVGVARRETSLQMALGMHLIHSGTTSLAEGVAGADVVVLATPIRTILAQIAEVGPLLPPGCVLTDVGSTKREIARAMEALPGHVAPIGGHPMCGKETSGLAVADQALYRDRVYVLSPLERTPEWAVSTMRDMVTAIGARPLLLEPERHDRLVAAISHLPYALSVALVNAAEALTGGDGLAWRLAASGFRDTSRVAASDLTMMVDILQTNRDEVLAGLTAARQELDALARCLEADDEEGLLEVLGAARRRRLEVFG